MWLGGTCGHGVGDKTICQVRAATICHQQGGTLSLSLQSFPILAISQKCHLAMERFLLFAVKTMLLLIQHCMSPNLSCRSNPPPAQEAVTMCKLVGD